MKQKIIRKKVLSAKQFQQIIDSYRKMLPQWMASPTLLINTLMFYFNSLMLLASYFLLIGQTLLILSSDKKLSNMKYVLLKWIIISLHSYLSEYLRAQNSESEVFILIGNLICFFFIYPFQVIVILTQFSKKLIQKYFFSNSNKTKNELDQSFDSKIPLFSRFIIWIIVSILIFSKYVLTFIHPSHRKQIELKVKQINMILLQEKYFWKIYDVNINGLKLQKSSSALLQNSTQSLKRQIQNPKISNMKRLTSEQQIQQANYIKKPSRQNKQTPPPIRYSAHMYIPVLGGLSKGVDNAKRRYTFYCQMQFQYNLATTQMKVTIPGEDKPHFYNLKQVQAIENDLIRFNFQEDSQQPEIIVKFINKEDKQTFFQKINSYQS